MILLPLGWPQCTHAHQLTLSGWQVQDANSTALANGHAHDNGHAGHSSSEEGDVEAESSSGSALQQAVQQVRPCSAQHLEQAAVALVAAQQAAWQLDAHVFFKAAGQLGNAAKGHPFCLHMCHPGILPLQQSL